MTKRHELVIAPQIDVDIPFLSIKEGVSNLRNEGAVYDISIIDQETRLVIADTCLKIEELKVIHSFIGDLISLRESDPNRQHLPE